MEDLKIKKLRENKVMTQEDKAKRYDEALHKAKRIINVCVDDNTECRSMIACIQELFPELKEESEDERIRKALIKYYSFDKDGGSHALDNITPKQILVWLEKQGESSIYNTPSREVILAIWDLGNEWKELTGGSISTKHGTQLTYIQKHWQESEYYLEAKQGDQKLPIEKLPSEMKTIGESLGFTTQEECDKYGQMVTDLIMSDDDKSEQKTADKAESKFKVGDWVTNGDYTWKIVEVKPLDYILQSQDGNIVDDTISHVDEQFHFFTIEDAKDGDVLFVKPTENLGKQLIIFGGIDSDSRIKYYCRFLNNKFSINDGLMGYDHKYFLSATKEQRDLLFQKMKETGYEWDADQKKLEKIKKAPQKFMVRDTIRYNGIEYKITEITPVGYKVYAPIYDKDAVSFISFSAPATLVEQKPAWSEKDDEIIEEIINDIECARAINYHAPKEGYEFRENWLESIKERVQPQSRQEWSEEDERIIKRIDSLLYSINENDFEDIHTWFESLKYRVQSKQEWNEEDITRLKSAITLLQNPLIACDEVNDGVRIKTVDWLKSIEGKVLLQLKQEWSGEDEGYYDAIIAKLEVTQEDALLTDNEMDFLKSLKERVQPKQEWSEEDKKCLRLSIDIIDSALRAGFCVQLDRDRCVDWLESIRHQNTWKPSEEQLNNILDVLSFDNCTPKRRELLESLYHDLKKLVNEK